MSLNPELGLEIKGTRNVIKLYFKADQPRKLEIRAIISLMDAVLQNTKNDLTMGVLDVRRGKLITDNPPAPALMALMQGEAAAIAPPTTLRQLSRLIEDCDLLVSADTGPAHIAVAVSTPVTAVYGPSDPVRNGPFDEISEVVRAEIDCIGCWKHKCGRGVPRCMEAINTKEVVRAAMRILERSAASPASGV